MAEASANATTGDGTTGAAADPAADRTQRFRPGHGPAPPPPPPTAKQVLGLRLVAPASANGHNTLKLTTWFEVRLLSPHGKPIADERCQVFTSDKKVIERKTNKQGVVRFDGLPLLPPKGSDINDTIHPAVVFPDILEEWVDKPPGDFGKHDGARDDYRKGDGAVHFAVGLEKRTEVKLGSLTAEQKFQHFKHAYVDNVAHYDNAKPAAYAKERQRWEWGKGSVCNQHVNFFLSYWFNYNGEFWDSVSTCMTALPLYSSRLHTFPQNKQHRSFLEFLEPVTGFGKTSGKAKAYNPDDKATWPLDKDLSSAFHHTQYIRIARYFDYDTGQPTEDGRKLIDALGEHSVYSVADIQGADESKAAEDEVRKWLKAHRADRAEGATDKQIDAKKSDELWRIVFDLDDDDPIDAKLVNAIKNCSITKVKNNKPHRQYIVNWDHHCGLLLVRESEDVPVGPKTQRKDRQLWTFSADGGHCPGPVIKMKKFTQAPKGLLYNKFLHLAIWRLKPLAGGFAPESVRANEGGIGVDWPPRFVHWTK